MSVDDLKFRRMTLIRDLVDNPLFAEIMSETRTQIALDMLKTPNETDRANLYHEARALERVQRNLTTIANAVRKTEGRESDG